MKAIIVGSGMSGLTTAAYLSKMGIKVIIYEQFSEIGGVTATISEQGFSWDLGPLLLQGFEKFGQIKAALEDLGIFHQLELIHDDRGLEFPDFKTWKLDEYLGRWWRRDYLKKLFPHQANNLDKYYEFYEYMYELVYLFKLTENSQKLKSFFLKILAFFKMFKKAYWWRNKNAEEILNYYFSDEKLKAVFTGILADFVVKPSQFTGIGIPLTHAENSFDIRICNDIKKGLEPEYYYIKGGCGKLVKILADFIISKGGIIKTNKCVQNVSIKNRKITGVILNDRTYEESDIVVLSCGVKEAFLDLIGEENLPYKTINHIKSLIPMESVLMVHLGINFDPSDYQRKPLCYYYGTYDIEGAVERCQNGIFHKGKEGFLIYIPSMHSPDMAPKGKFAITIYTIAPDKLKDGNWESLKEEYTDFLLDEAEQIIPGLRKGTEIKIIMTPLDFRQRIHVKHHGFGGLSPIIGQKGPNYHTPIENLWYVGAQSESGGGVEGVVGGARKLIGLIKKHCNI